MRRAARLVVLLGAVGGALWFLRGTPRDVDLVYGLGDRPVASLEVEVARGSEILRRAELRPGAGPAGNVHHRVRLPDGEYTLRLRVAPRDGAPWRADRTITVSESATIVIPLGGP